MRKYKLNVYPSVQHRVLAKAKLVLLLLLLLPFSSVQSQNRDHCLWRAQGWPQTTSSAEGEVDRASGPQRTGPEADLYYRDSSPGS